MAGEKEKQLALRKLIKKARQEGKPEVEAKAIKLFEDNKRQFFYKKKHTIPNSKADVISDSVEIARFENPAEVIDTREIQKIGKGSKITKKKAMSRLAKLAGKAGKKLPGVLGALMAIPAFMHSPDAAAADMAGVESMGSDPAIEDPTSPEFKARERMLKLKFKKSKKR